jgi:hypothetical protein
VRIAIVPPTSNLNFLSLLHPAVLRLYMTSCSHKAKSDSAPTLSRSSLADLCRADIFASFLTHPKAAAFFLTIVFSQSPPMLPREPRECLTIIAVFSALLLTPLAYMCPPVPEALQSLWTTVHRAFYRLDESCREIAVNACIESCKLFSEGTLGMFQIACS